MAAAYAAVVSLTHIIEQIMEYHPHRPFFLGKQKRQLDSLQKKVGFLKSFLEVYSSKGNNIAQQGLESRIAEAAYVAEDVIESYVAHTIYGKSSSNIFLQGLQIVIEIIDSINKEVMVIKKKARVEAQKESNILVPIALSRRPTMGKNIKVEYYEEDLERIMDTLTGQSSNLQIIPIVGMGGIGKTTIARYIFENQLIVECFPFRAWVTVSQEYNLVEILLHLLRQIGSPIDKQETREFHQLGERLHKHLLGRKYLIIIDDMWSDDVWEKLKLFLPNQNNGCRVIITTRLLKVVDGSDPSLLYKMNLLDENKSWSLLRTEVFGHDGKCPLELEEIGKDIAKNCKGLPLSIVVIGGLLSKSEMTQNYWEYVAEDINQIVNSEGNGRWLNILNLSYTQLPIHLKPCFLYMGCFKEDSDILISDLIKIWVAEGFLKTCRGKSLEEAAEDYLKDLIDRNLVFVRDWGSVGRMKKCGIHDLLRDLCLKEAQKDRFFGVVKKRAEYVDKERRIIFREGEWDYEKSKRIDFAKYAEPYIRSLCDFGVSGLLSLEIVQNLRLIRVLAGVKSETIESILQLVNLRYLNSAFMAKSLTTHLPPVMCQLGYLQTLILKGILPFVAPYEIWEMPQLMHIIVDPSMEISDRLRSGMNGQDAGCVLRNLQTLKKVSNFRFTEDVIARIPNIKKLSIVSRLWSIPNYNNLHNLNRLSNLQSLTCGWVGNRDLAENLTLPQSLNKLTLSSCSFDWDSLTIKVGSLPNLEKLKLDCCYLGDQWDTVDGKFPRLKFLEITENPPRGLVRWTSDSDHFPLLQHLVLLNMERLEKIPSEIGDTLQLIELHGDCGSSVIASAKEIVAEQESNGNEDLRLTIRGYRLRRI